MFSVQSTVTAFTNAITPANVRMQALLIDVKLLWGFSVDSDPTLLCWQHIKVGCVAKVSVKHAAPIFRVDNEHKAERSSKTSATQSTSI